METVWILGDQLSRGIASLEGRDAGDTRILMVESATVLGSRRWHRQRLHLVLTAMRRFARELEREGFDVDFRTAPSFADGLRAHRLEHRPARVLAMEPSSYDLRELLDRLCVELVRSNQFLCHYEEFANWAEGRKRLRLEDFYRWQRRRLGVLMDGDEPAGGRWNYDSENREPPPPTAERGWPEPVRSRLDEVDREVLDSLPPNVFGAQPAGLWATSRRGAFARLRRFVDDVLPRFGPHQDAMLEGDWHLAHSLLGHALNLGLLHPLEVCEAAETAYREGRAPIASVEGFVRQALGWREYVWGVYWLEMPGYREANALGATRPLPPVFRGEAETEMRCLADALAGVEERAYLHHIQRLMVVGNLGLLAGIVPLELADWMTESFVDSAEWVMLPNVLGMALYADGGLMATKPYAASGRYLDRMSDHCASCRFDPAKRVGDEACPYTTLYWDFLARNRERLEGNPRLGNQLRTLGRLRDVPAVRERAREVLDRLDRGRL
ncbi:MAG: cryptochrome/photolyase family protein [Gaiellaceae bacterium]